MPPTSATAARSRNPTNTNETKKVKSGIPLKESSKTITKRQTKPPAAAALSRLKEKAASAISSKKVTSQHPSPIKLRFGGSKSSAAAASRSKTETKNKTVEKKTPVVIDIDIDSEDEDEDKSDNKPQTKSTASTEAPPLLSSGSTLKTSKKTQREETDWKSRCFAAEQQLLEKEEIIQQLEVKIPTMIEEFQRQASQQDDILEQKNQEMKEYQAVIKEKENRIAKLETENKANAKNRNADAVKKNENFKKEIAAKVKEISNLKEKLQDSVSAGKKRQEELREKNKECSEKTKVIMELEDLKPKLKLQVEIISKLEKEKDEKMEQIEVLNKEMKSQSNREQDYRVRIENGMKMNGKLKEETEEYKKKNTELNSKLAILDADLNLHFNLVEDKDEEIRISNENLGKLKNEKEFLESNLKKTKEEKESLQSQLKSAKEGLAVLATIQNKMRGLMKTTETQNEIIGNNKVALEKYRRQTEETAKKMKDQNLKIMMANETNSKLNNENKIQTEGNKKLNEKNIQLQLILNNEVQHNKKTQDMLCGQLNALEVQNFNKKETIVQLEAELKSLKEERKRSLQCTTLKKAAKEYMKLVRRRQVDHLTHESCSEVQQEEVTQQDPDPVTLDEDSLSLLDEEPMLIVDTSYEEEDIIYIEENPTPSPDTEVIMEDVGEDSSCPPPPSDEEREISYPNNMLTYLWPCLPWAKNQEKGKQEKEEEEVNTDVLLQTPKKPSISSLTSTCGNSEPGNPRIFLRCLNLCPVSVCRPTKRKSVDIVARPSKRRRYTEEIIRIPVPSPSLAITYNWPVMIYQGNLFSQDWTGRVRRGTKRSRESQDEGSNPNKRIKLDWNSSYFPGPSPGLVILRQDLLLAQLRTLSIATTEYILDDLLTEVLSVSNRQPESQGVVGSLIQNMVEVVVQHPQPHLEEEPNWPLVPYKHQSTRFNYLNDPVNVNLEVTAVSPTDQNPAVLVVTDVLEKILLTVVSDTEDFPISSSSENNEISTVEKGENSGKICEELLLNVLESERFQKSGQVG